METKELDFEALLEDTLKTLHTGDTVNGIVCTVGDNEIKLDLGVKVTGILTKEQITDDPNANLRDMFKVGDEVAVFVRSFAEMIVERVAVVREMVYADDRIIFDRAE